MVDSIGGLGASHNIQHLKNNHTQKSSKPEAVAASVDQVSLSDEALSLSESEGVAAQVRSLLEEQPDVTLSSGGHIDALL